MVAQVKMPDQPKIRLQAFLAGSSSYKNLGRIKYTPDKGLGPEGLSRDTDKLGCLPEGDDNGDKQSTSAEANHFIRICVVTYGKLWGYPECGKE